MANLAIIDSGYISINKKGAQEDLIANSGSAINLKSVDLSYVRGKAVDNTPTVGSTENSELNAVTTQNPVITINGVLKRTNAVDMALLLKLDTLCRTNGIKLLYYTVGSDDDDYWSNLVISLGQENIHSGTNEKGETIDDKHTNSTGELYNGGSPLAHLHVFCKGLRVGQVADSEFLRFSLTCEITINADSS